jgi:glycosyltransferase involved in cell wall biosynthesis
MIHYGLPRDLYQYEPHAENYAVWIGKIEGGKAPKLAIKLARAAGIKIVLMGPPYNTGCFWEQVGPYIDNEHVFWVRGVDDEQKKRIMSKAKVFISSNDNTWREHFGIVNAEALAMGVPILAFNRIGQECAIWTDNIIRDGEHGFFLNYRDSNDEQEIIGKGVPLLKKIMGGAIYRSACRKHFEDNFTADLEATRYDWLYKFIKENGPVGSVEVPF